MTGRCGRNDGVELSWPFAWSQHQHRRGHKRRKHPPIQVIQSVVHRLPIVGPKKPDEAGTKNSTAASRETPRWTRAKAGIWPFRSRRDDPEFQEAQIWK